jgi:hypothetical protein
MAAGVAGTAGAAQAETTRAISRNRKYAGLFVVLNVIAVFLF